MDIENKIKQLKRTETTNELKEVFSVNMKQFGTGGIFVHVLPIPSAPNIYNWNPIVNSFSDAASRIFCLALESLDPFFRAALTETGPVHYQNLLRSRKMGSEQINLFLSLQRLGIVDGLATTVMAKVGAFAFAFVGFHEEKKFDESITLRKYQVYITEFFIHYTKLVDFVVPSLSERELQILLGILSAKSNTEMASEFGLSISTVDTYVRRLFEKMNVNSRIELGLKYFGYFYDREI